VKNITTYNNFINESSDDWTERNVNIPTEEFFGKWFQGKEKIDEDDNYITYKFYNKTYDEKDEEYFWETEKIIKLDKRRPDITHYYEMDLIDRPIYSIRVDGMTHDQELKIRCWCGTDKNPKQGSFEGFEKQLAMMKSYLSNKDGKLYHITPRGEFVEMLDDEKLKDGNYVDEMIDFLLDTGNTHLIKIVQDQVTRLENS
jgi:hypothetical protein